MVSHGSKEYLKMKKTLVLLSVFLIVSCNKPGKDALCREAPDFTLKKFDGTSLTLSQFKGKVVLIDFWVSWCPICQMDMPNFVKLYENYNAKGLEIIGICYDKELESARDLMNKLKLEYPVVIGNDDVAKTYKWRVGKPATIVVDKKGNIVDELRGVRSYKKLEKAIENII